ncbi:hypothetical protein cypCar_00027378 [Cyprinus carpio]|nr:hypothetical protein cypCar_00027378 [Cyprinus carpio]
MVPLFARSCGSTGSARMRLFLRQEVLVNPEAEGIWSRCLSRHLSPYRVLSVRVLRECLRYVVPRNSGIQENQLHFLSNVKNFLRLGSSSVSPLMQLMWKMKVKACLGWGSRNVVFNAFILWPVEGAVSISGPKVPKTTVTSRIAFITEGEQHETPSLALRTRESCRCFPEWACGSCRMLLSVCLCERPRAHGLHASGAGSGIHRVLKEFGPQQKRLAETAVRGGDVFQFFQKMLSSYIIHHDNKMFRQVCGIPQGSSVSALLCNLCYGHMENSLLKGIAKGGCLMRLVDDFLLITPHLSKATEFLTTLLAGVPDYGCQINPQKVAVNFPVCVEWLDSGVRVLPSCCLFPWCGLLLDTHSLDVYKDYSRFHACVRSLPLGQNVESNPCFFLKMIWTMSRVTNRLIRHINKGRSAGFSSDSHVKLT